MEQWLATWRYDHEEHFCTESHIYKLDTQILSEAAKLIEEDIGDRGTLFDLRRESI